MATSSYNSSNNESEVAQWVGNTETATDKLSATPLNGLAATLDSEQQLFAEGEPVPPLWHWLFCLKAARQSQLSHDGHPRKGDFLPPIDLPRRMWAGSRVRFHHSLVVGGDCIKHSTIKDIAFKNGRSGQLAFVKVGHEISDSQGLAISEEQDIVYRDNPSPDAALAKPIQAPEQHDYSLSISPDPVLLFRYSALTFNSHRIHYDRDYATEEEGYPGLVVHGPLLATLMVELLGRQFVGKRLASFEFRAMSPVFDGGEFLVCGLEADESGACELWVQNGVGELCMKGVGVFGG